MTFHSLTFSTFQKYPKYSIIKITVCYPNIFSIKKLSLFTDYPRRYFNQKKKRNPLEIFTVIFLSTKKSFQLISKHHLEIPSREKKYGPLLPISNEGGSIVKVHDFLKYSADIDTLLAINFNTDEKSLGAHFFSNKINWNGSIYRFWNETNEKSFLVHRILFIFSHFCFSPVFAEKKYAF